MTAEQTRGGRETEGLIVKAANDKTRVVAIEQRTTHRLYGRGIKRVSKLVAHDENNQSGVGDTVRIRECRPLSRSKRWRLVEILVKHRED
ncbi:MAG: 30S ribosomal protein S17 [Gemmatimonadetes bacterium]|jgi:small subunit ribosomal protein S17|nr:30S ribosomal protein S17 [Gemmatimonadota bacterium]